MKKSKGKSAKASYEVGFGKPPKATRFQKGISGNLKGRPKARTGISAALIDELQARVPIVENGKERKISFEQVIAKQVRTKAAQGDLRAAAMIFKETQQLQTPAETHSGLEALDNAAHRQIVRSIIVRIRTMDDPPDGEE